MVEARVCAKNAKNAKNANFGGWGGLAELPDNQGALMGAGTAPGGAQSVTCAHNDAGRECSRPTPC